MGVENTSTKIEKCTDRHKRPKLTFGGKNLEHLENAENVGEVVKVHRQIEVTQYIAILEYEIHIWKNIHYISF